VAHHVRPPLRPDATWEEDEAGKLLDLYRPDYWLAVTSITRLTLAATLGGRSSARLRC
jgi:hypothetical protein